jgi:hypothetical protein
MAYLARAAEPKANLFTQIAKRHFLLTAQCA